MDNKTIFVKTSKGEDEMLSRTSHLADDVKRALLMVDGSSTFGEISKRAAPSMRASLGETLQELEKNGFIQDMDAVGKTPRIAVPPKMAVPSKMVVPIKTPTPKQQPVDDAADGELDFMSGFTASEAPGAGPAEAENLRAESDGISQQEMEAAIFGTPQGAESIPHVSEADKLKAEQETRLRIEAAVSAQKQAEEAVHIKAEQQAAKAREAAQPSQTTPGAKPDTFAFDAFHVDASQDFAFGKFKIDEPRGSAEPHKERQPEQPARPAAKPTTFAFDAFQIDEPKRAAELHKERQSTQQASPAQQHGEAAKTTRPEDVRQPAKQQVPPPVASKPVKRFPGLDTIRRAIQERKEVDGRRAAEALEAKKMAEAKAKVLAEAEQRRTEAAKAEMQQLANKARFTVDNAPVAKSAPVARARRKSFSWGKLAGFIFKLGLFLLVLLVGVLFVIPYLVPMRNYMPKAEQMLSAKLHQPVHIGHLSGRILPMPRLELGEIYIGEGKQFQADEARINFALIGLFTNAKPVSSVEFQGVKVRGAWLRNVSVWLQQMANEEKYPVKRMVISQGKLDADVFELTGIEGELDFDSVGKFTQTHLRANSGKYALGINATPVGKLQTVITVRGSALPLLPNWTFDDLTAKGELNNNELVINDIDASILGGAAQGNASINWRSGWNAQGALSAKTIPLQQLSKLLDGNVEGSARFKMNSMDLASLTDSVVLEGSFAAKNGTISGMDIVETARMRSRENLPGGRTHFDNLSGVVSYANNGYHFKQVKVAAGVMNATATFDVTRQQLSGKMNVSLSLQDSAGHVDLQMGGTIDSPTLRYAP